MADRALSLTQDRLKELLVYEPETGAFTWKPGTGGKGRPFRPRQAGKLNVEGYRRIQVDGRMYAGSRLAWLYMTGEWPPEQIDHRNGNTSDDSFSNLRPASQNENKANSRAYKNNGLGVKGVRLHRNGQYEARLRVEGKLRYLGCFRTIDAAKAAYDEAALEAFGEFARSA